MINDQHREGERENREGNKGRVLFGEGPPRRERGERRERERLAPKMGVEGSKKQVAPKQKKAKKNS